MNSRNPIKTQKYVLFGKKDLRVKMQQIKNVLKFGTIVMMQENIEVLHVLYVI